MMSGVVAVIACPPGRCDTPQGRARRWICDMPPARNQRVCGAGVRICIAGGGEPDEALRPPNHVDAVRTRAPAVFGADVFFGAEAGEERRRAVTCGDRDPDNAPGRRL